MKFFLVTLIFLVVLPLVCLPAVSIYDNFSFGAGSYIGNSTDADVELPAGFGLRANFSISNMDNNRIFGYSLGVAKDLFQFLSVDVSYAGNKANSYISDSLGTLFSCRPFMSMSTFVEFQIEGGYSFILHSDDMRSKSLPCHMGKIGIGVGVMQTTGLALSYSFYNYVPSVPDGYTLLQAQNYIPASFNPQLSGVLGIISGFPASTFDLSIYHYLTDELNLYFSYSSIRQALDDSVSHSFLLGGDYYVLPDWSIGIAYNLFRYPAPSLFSYYSLNTRISF